MKLKAIKLTHTKAHKKAQVALLPTFKDFLNHEATVKIIYRPTFTTHNVKRMFAKRKWKKAELQ